MTTTSLLCKLGSVVALSAVRSIGAPRKSGNVKSLIGLEFGGFALGYPLPFSTHEGERVGQVVEKFVCLLTHHSAFLPKRTLASSTTPQGPMSVPPNKQLSEYALQLLGIQGNS